MRILEGKKALILGVANPQSIAWGVAQSFYQQGAQIALSCANDFLVKMVKIISPQVGSDLVLKCDVSKDEEISFLAKEIKEKWGELDILVHSIAFAPKDIFEKSVLETKRESFKTAFDISVYSLIALSREFLPLMEKRKGTILTFSYYGSQKVIPNYNLMGPVKSALESFVRYLAFDLGKKNIRINCISPGPIKTLAASAIPGFEILLEKSKNNSALKRNVDFQDIGKLAVFLASDLSDHITG
ncbi:MAG: enoyl-ACP reductase FabI, partial [Microgenomates group bacterium]